MSKFLGRPVSTRTCTVDGCTSRHKAHGYCSKHLRRYERHGSAFIVKASARPRIRGHGTEAHYKLGCRCSECKAAKAQAERDRRHRNQGVRSDVPVEPLQELLACLKGFGISHRQVSRAMNGQNRTLRILTGETAEAATADRLNELHWGLWHVHGPFRRHCRCEIPEEVEAELKTM